MKNLNLYTNEWWRFAIMATTIVLLNTSTTLAQAVSPGIAPIDPPTGGFHIEGNLMSNIPTCGVGDWLPGTGTGGCTSGGHVLSATGVPIDATTTYHRTDLFTSGDDVFAGGQKKNDNPNFMTWIIGNPSPAKNDINHFLMHISTNPNNGNTWILLSGDRESTNGNSFLSLQFLQKTLTKETDGTFASEAPNTTGGRTVGDLQISAEFVNGGGNPVLYLERWELSGGVYKWVAKSFPSGSAFGAVNSAVLTNNAYTSFGGNSYQANAFMEVAVDITAIIEAVSGEECFGRISTLWPMTKSSQSETANLTDFVDPLQINLDINIELAADDPDPQCDGTIDLAETITSDKTGLTFEYYDTDPNGTPTPDPLQSSVVSTSGTYYIKAISETETLCSDVVSVIVSIGNKPARPVVELLPAEICGTRSAPAIKILCPVAGTYTVTQPNETARTHTYPTDGDIIGNLVAGKTFSITVTVNGCTSDATDCTNYTTNSCPTNGTGSLKSESSSSLKTTKQPEERNITAYPVPFRDRVNVDFKSQRSGNYSINLYDSKGKLIKELKAGKAKTGQLQSIEVDGRNLPDGMYFIRVVDGAGSRTVKLLKKE